MTDKVEPKDDEDGCELGRIAKALDKRWRNRPRPWRKPEDPYAASWERTRRALIASLRDEDY